MNKNIICLLVAFVLTGCASLGNVGNGVSAVLSDQQLVQLAVDSLVEHERTNKQVKLGVLILGKFLQGATTGAGQDPKKDEEVRAKVRTSLEEIVAAKETTGTFVDSSHFHAIVSMVKEHCGGGEKLSNPAIGEIEESRQNDGDKGPVRDLEYKLMKDAVREKDDAKIQNQRIQLQEQAQDYYDN